jgi:hypothetical protein
LQRLKIQKKLQKSKKRQWKMQKSMKIMTIDNN